MITIKTSEFQIDIDLDDKGNGFIVSTIERIPLEPILNQEEINAIDYDDAIGYNAAVDGIESLILAHACADIDVQSPTYILGIQTAMEAISNAFN